MPISREILRAVCLTKAVQAAIPGLDEQIILNAVEPYFVSSDLGIQSGALQDIAQAAVDEGLTSKVRGMAIVPGRETVDTVPTIIMNAPEGTGVIIAAHYWEGRADTGHAEGFIWGGPKVGPEVMRAVNAAIYQGGDLVLFYPPTKE